MLSSSRTLSPTLHPGTPSVVPHVHPLCSPKAEQPGGKGPDPNSASTATYELACPGQAGIFASVSPPAPPGTTGLSSPHGFGINDGTPGKAHQAGLQALRISTTIFCLSGTSPPVFCSPSLKFFGHPPTSRMVFIIQTIILGDPKLNPFSTFSLSSLVYANPSQSRPLAHTDLRDAGHAHRQLNRSWYSQYPAPPPPPSKALLPSKFWISATETTRASHL